MFTAVGFLAIPIQLPAFTQAANDQQYAAG